MKMCIKCNKRPIHVKKRELCSACYQKWFWANRRLKSPAMRQNYLCSDVKITHSREIEFSKRFFNHKNWMYEPATFRFNGHSYLPDFYDGERNVFIEVAGSRQAYSLNKEKYKEFLATYPKIKFEIRTVNGDLIELDEKRLPQNTFSEK